MTSQPKPTNMKNLTNMTRVMALSGVVTLANAHGETTAEADKATLDHALAANSDFAIDLYHQLAGENPGANLFFSPYSISTALAMVAEGAREETAIEIGEVLRYPEAARSIGGDARLLPWNTSLIHTGMKALQDRLQTAPQDDPEAGEVPFQLHIANRLFGEQTYPFDQNYLDTISGFYGAGVIAPKDFRENHEAARREINQWVEEQTEERIADLLGAGALDEFTRLVLVNAIYFKGDWATQFDAENTMEEDFQAPGAKVSVPMMRKNGMPGTRYAAFDGEGKFFETPAMRGIIAENPPFYPEADGFQILELPYKGGELSMVIMLPQDAAGLDALERNLTSANLNAWLDKVEQRPVNVQMPKFRMETDYQKMAGTLEAMGMRRAVTDPRDPDNGAQFHGMTTSTDPMEQLYISTVAHKAFVEVNEEGTEAAAATAVVMPTPRSAGPEPFTPTFRADRPFLFAIRDMETGTILFLGRMVDPTA